MAKSSKINHSHTFRRQKVTPEERDRLISTTFQSLAPYYDRLMDIQTFGLHRYWRRVLVRILVPRPGQRLLDVAGGTGQMAKRLAASNRTVIVLEPSLPMIETGRSQDIKDLCWVAGRARALPFSDNSMDTVVCTFGIRNVTYVERAMHEVYRVIKPGGCFICMEVSRPWPIVRPLYYAYCRFIVPRLSSWIIPLPKIYEYLVDSILDFPDRKEIRRLFKENGFIDVKCRRLTLGIVCLHTGVKPGGGN
ncbi:MAG: ubiquinone/menaquinone biosynthesis methyltransferase [Gammaproteobacteria bacterium]|jgi:demethylmenaquinone methyltransferase/2-methoxy-6-polyprenyl-1,4-benzoquinol methylase